MFALHKLWMLNFRTYKGAHEFEFPSASGLYYFSGNNKVDDLGSNGSGKSTFLDAITWCLYGKTARGLKASEIITWGMSTANVTLDLTVGGKRFKVKRSQKPNTLLLVEDGVEKPVDQEELEKHIRLNFKAFTYSVLNAQFGTSFFSLGATEKLDLFSKIMDLDYWLEKSDEASTASKALLKNITTLEATIAQCEGKQAVIKQDINKLQDQAAAFEEDIARRAADLHMKMRESFKLAEKLEERLSNTDAQWGTAAAEFKGLVEEIAAAEKYRDTTLKSIQILSKELAGIQGEHKIHLELLKKAKELKDYCPTCVQAIDKNHMAEHIFDLEAQIKADEFEMGLSQKKIQAWTKELVLAKNKLDAAVKAAESKKNEKDNLKRKSDKLLDQLETATKDYDDFSLRFKAAKEEQNPFDELLRQKKKQLTSCKSDLAEAHKTKMVLEAENEAVSYWVKGFKMVRLFIIEQAFQTLEVEVNNSLAQLGMPEWQISFDVERENKSGGITKGFTVLIKSPRNKDAVKWESWSGGETQRLQLAGDLGLANLIMQQAGLTNTIEFFDEPSTHLSQEGMLDLANMLHERAITEDKQIWIVDHAAITNFGEFRGVITATKDNSGSRIRLDD